jgi:anti-sigma factor ChrR (cupin superfamily)
MARKSAHPDRKLFDYLSGAMSDEARRPVEQHLAICADCAAIADLVRALKDQADENRDRTVRSSEAAQLGAQPAARSPRDEHPDVAALAAFFYNKSPRQRNAQVAAHVAQCRHCAAEMALYAQAEHAAMAYETAAVEANAVPAAAWEMIREWEESAFARPKPASETAGHELLAKLTTALREQRRQAGLETSEDAVPVTVIDREGHVRGVEMFKQDTDAQGASILRHAEASEQFDARPVHVLLDFGDENHIILSERIERDTLRLKQPVRQTKPLRADYFIIED